MIGIRNIQESLVTDYGVRVSGRVWGEGFRDEGVYTCMYIYIYTHTLCICGRMNKGWVGYPYLHGLNLLLRS